MSNTTLQAAYEAAVEEFGQEIADQAASISQEAWNVNAAAGFDQAVCEAEQLAAFAQALQDLN